MALYINVYRVIVQSVIVRSSVTPYTRWLGFDKFGELCSPTLFRTKNRSQMPDICRFFVRFSGFGGDFWRILEKISDLHLELRHPRTTSGGEISVRCSPNTYLPNEIFRFPIPPLGKFPGCFPQKSHIYNGITIPRPFLYYFFTF